MAVKKILRELQIKKIFTLIKDNFAKLNHTHDKATTTTDGFMAAADKVKLDGIETGANKYTHPTFTAKASGLYKITVNDQGHVSAAEEVAKADITALGIPAQDTTYPVASSTVDGLMSSEDKTKLDSLSNYELTPATSSTLGGVKIGNNINSSADGKISIADASVTTKGVVKLSTATNSTSTEEAATASAVKSVYDLANGKQSPATTLAGYGIADAYTKDEVNGLVSSAFHYKGSKDTYAELPKTGNKVGDVWNIVNADKANGIKAGDNVAWDGTAWDVLAGVMDLSGYAQTSDFVEYSETEIQGMWDEVMNA